jgi:hypothetical protein
LGSRNVFMYLGSPYRNKTSIKGPIKTKVYKLTAPSSVLTQSYLLTHETKNCLNSYYLNLPLNLKEHSAYGYEVRTTGIDRCPRADIIPQKKPMGGDWEDPSTPLSHGRAFTQKTEITLGGGLQCIAERHRYLCRDSSLW